MSAYNLNFFFQVLWNFKEKKKFLEKYNRKSVGLLQYIHYSTAALLLEQGLASAVGLFFTSARRHRFDRSA